MAETSLERYERLQAEREKRRAEEEKNKGSKGWLETANDYWLGGQGIKKGILEPAKEYWFGKDEGKEMNGALEEINVIPQRRLPERIPGGPRDPGGTPRGGPALSLPASPDAPGAVTPASTGSGGGAGNPMQMFESADPESVLTSAETAAKAAAKSGATADPQADEQKKKINESMAAQGMDPVKAYEEMRDQFSKRLETQYAKGEITKKQHKGLKNRWKNIFNVVPEEDMGLFLMDFGLRLAAHSADSDFGSAVGQAGIGALGGVQERKRYDQEMGLKRDEAAHGRAMDVTKLGMEGERNAALSKYYERVGSGSRAQQTIDTDQGLIEFNPETKKWQPVEVDGKRVKKSYSGDRGYQGEKFWLKQQLEGSGRPVEEVENLILGAKTPQERAQVLQDTLAKLKENYVARDRQGQRYSEYTRQQEAAWIAEMMQAADDAVSKYRQQGALPE